MESSVGKSKRQQLYEMWGEKVFCEKRHFAIFCSLLKSRLGWTDRDIGKWFGKEAFNRIGNSIASLPRDQVSSLIREFTSAFPARDLKRFYRNVSVSVVGRGRLLKGITKESHQRDIIDTALGRLTTEDREYLVYDVFQMVDAECRSDELLSMLTCQMIFAEVISRLAAANREMARGRREFRELIGEPVNRPEGKRKRRLDI